MSIPPYGEKQEEAAPTTGNTPSYAAPANATYAGQQGAAQSGSYGSAPSHYPPSAPPQPPQGYHHQPTYTQRPYVNREGEDHANKSLIFGIISVFIFGIVFGPLAISRAKKAKAMGVNNGSVTAGLVTGWIGLVSGILTILYLILMIVLFSAGYDTAGTTSGF